MTVAIVVHAGLGGAGPADARDLQAPGFRMWIGARKNGGSVFLGPAVLPVTVGFRV